MRKLAHLVLVTLFVLGCSGSKETSTSNLSSEKMELGWIHRTNFMSPDYPKFQQMYDTTTIEPQFVEMIQQLHNDVEFVVVLGTWCGDSRRAVPRFLKIIDLASVPSSRIQFYGVDRTKRSADGVTERYNIERVPTFIFFKHGKEVGRIVEAPKNTIEEDMLAILADAQNK
jgi:thiol-disulfide isomerase/thioredoxin